MFTDNEIPADATQPAASRPVVTPPAEIKKPVKRRAPKKAAPVKMGKNLVIVESPAKAKTIEKYLGAGFRVKASMGHVRDLPKSKLGVDVENGFKPQYLVLRERKKLIKELQADSVTAPKIYLCPDPDREGEAIAWHLSEVLTEDRDKVCRVTFNEITESAIKAAFQRPGKINMDKVASQQARRILDRIVGYKISPMLWKKVGSGLSAGRVQSVAVRIICDREQEIGAFVPQEYWTLLVKLSKPQVPDSAFWAALKKVEDKKPELVSKEQTDKIVAELANANYVVSDVKKKERAQNPVPPFTTSLLQQASVNRLHWSIGHTMFMAQQLYEGLELGPEGPTGLITYMRTDSFRISKDAQVEAAEFIAKTYGANYVPATPNRYRSKKSAQEAHEAIRPTSAFRTPDSVQQYLTHDQYVLYKLIWERFVASQMTSARMLVTSVEIKAAKCIFGASGTEMLFPGFLAVYQIEVEPPKPADKDADKDKEEEKAQEEKEKDEEESPEETNKMPALEINDKLDYLELKPGQHFTKPPPRYSEATLVKILEELGIGRPSTYAPTINTILRRDYVTKDRGKLHPTDLGKLVNNLLVEHFPEVLDLKFTAQMENNLDEVEEGKTEWVKVLQEFYVWFEKSVAKAGEFMKDMKPELIKTNELCEKCGKAMVIKFGRFGRFVACSGYPECKNTKSLPTGVKCPKENCGGDLTKRRSKVGRTFYGCSKYPACDFVARSLSQVKKPKEEGGAEAPAAGDAGETKGSIEKQQE